MNLRTLALVLACSLVALGSVARADDQKPGPIPQAPPVDIDPVSQ